MEEVVDLERVPVDCNVTKQPTGLPTVCPEQPGLSQPLKYTGPIL
jgi:hypothetical protein